MNAIETAGMTSKQIEQYNEAERLIAQWREIGERASKLLYSARDSIAGIDWFDHRHHLLNPSIEFLDFCMISGTNVVAKIPVDGVVLDLCCGDGFYDYYFYRHKSAYILGVDISERAIALARREHSAPNIEYVTGNILTYSFPGIYDVIICRGAIEHFTEDEQGALMANVRDILKPDGWFCGDTVAPMNTSLAHKHEWTCESEMRDALAKVFRHIETNALISRERTTLLWRCQK